MKKIRVGVLAGGASNEREISLRSGKAVYDALIREGINAIFLEIENDIKGVIENNKVDVAFIVLHGRSGEDGTVQRILEEKNIPYTGSGVEASALALDKIASKKIFEKYGIPIAKYAVLNKDSALSTKTLNTEGSYELGLPLIVKPQSEGSSIGLSIVREKAFLRQAIDKAFDYGPKVLLEEYIEGRELTVGILDEEPLPVIEIVTKERVYDYKAKYNDPETKYLVPAPIDDKAYAKAKGVALRAHKALGCKSFSRVDIMMDSSGNMFVLEVNSIPGMTERSLFPKAAGAIGLNFNNLCIKLIENVLK